MPLGTSPAKIRLIERFGGEPHFVSCSNECAAAQAAQSRLRAKARLERYREGFR
jgi:hypothetical protein